VSRIVLIHHASWADPASSHTVDTAAAALEQGSVLFMPHLAFGVGAGEQQIFSPDILAASKNTSFEPESGHVAGSTLKGPELERLRRLVARFSHQAAQLVDRLLPRYRGRIVRARASFRPAEIAGRHTSWRKDDTRLHVDSFPASPVQGRRILRVFSNVNPSGRARTWRVGGDFEAVATRFAPKLRMPPPGSGTLLRALRVTKARRSPYDSMMLQLHDRMKADADFQERSEQERFEFPAGSTWLALTDAVSHAAMAGQYQLEQTFLLPVSAMLDETRSPLRILERIKQRRLV
jgi:3-deoxy-D-manno-octulosonic acid hydroxylase-like protein